MGRFFSPNVMRRMQSDKKGKKRIYRCGQEHKHDSKAEASHCDFLVIRLRGGEIKGFERQKTFRLDVGGHHICSHRVDFVVEYADGHKEVEEVKGFPNETWPIKKALFEVLYPSIKYNVIVPNYKKSRFSFVPNSAPLPKPKIERV